MSAHSSEAPSSLEMPSSSLSVPLELSSEPSVSSELSVSLDSSVSEFCEFPNSDEEELSVVGTEERLSVPQETQKIKLIINDAHTIIFFNILFLLGNATCTP